MKIMASKSDDIEFSEILCTVDVLPLRVREGVLEIGLVRRNKKPYEGKLALPGGFIRDNEDDDTGVAAKRIARHKAGIEVTHLEQLATYSGRKRDPRRFSLSVAYLAIFAQDQEVESKELRWFPLSEAATELKLAFDHNVICSDALERLAGKAGYTPVTALFAGKEFTLSQIQSIYEALTRAEIDKKTFRRRIDELGWADPIEGKMFKPHGKASRPAQVFTLKSNS